MNISPRTKSFITKYVEKRHGKLKSLKRYFKYHGMWEAKIVWPTYSRTCGGITLNKLLKEIDEYAKSATRRTHRKAP